MINLTVLEELAARILKGNRKELDTVIYLLIQVSLSGEEINSFSINTNSYNLNVCKTSTNFNRDNNCGNSSDDIT